MFFCLGVELSSSWKYDIAIGNENEVNKSIEIVTISTKIYWVVSIIRQTFLLHLQHIFTNTFHFTPFHWCICSKSYIIQLHSLIQDRFSSPSYRITWKNTWFRCDYIASCDPFANRNDFCLNNISPNSMSDNCSFSTFIV